MNNFRTFRFWFAILLVYFWISETDEGTHVSNPEIVNFLCAQWGVSGLDYQSTEYILELILD